MNFFAQYLLSYILYQFYIIYNNGPNNNNKTTRGGAGRGQFIDAVRLIEHD